MKQTDPLSMRFRSIVERKWTLLAEVERQYGPGLHRAPVKQSNTIGRKRRVM
jgi:hypothetical protein